MFVFVLLSAALRDLTSIRLVQQTPARVTINARELTPLGVVAKKDPLTIFAKGSAGEASIVVGCARSTFGVCPLFA